MNEYYFVQDPDPSTFEEECSKKLKEGWTPQGGISQSNFKDVDGCVQFLYAQAFVR